jgi:hypothetical protein
MPTTLFLVPLVLAICALCVAGLLAKRLGPFVPFAFIAAYILAVGAILFVNIGVFHMVDPKFHHHWVNAWLEFYWPLWTTFFAPSAIFALVACWFSRPLNPRDAAALLGVYLLLVLFMLEVAWALDLRLASVVGEFVLGAIFMGAAYWKRTLNVEDRDFSALRSNPDQ